MIRSHNKPWPWIGLGLLLFLMICGIGLSVVSIIGATADVAGARVGLIEYSGAITDEGSASLIGMRSGGARTFIEDVERARRDKSIRAVVLRVNSPGGSPAASQEMYQAIKRLRQAKPVVCSMGDAAASGGYYIAAACDKIYANPSTVTGSIGVISQSLNFSGLLNKYGVKDATQKSGKFKDTGNPFGPVNPAHQQLQQELIQSIYQRFINDVLAGREKKLTRSQLLKLADGRVYTGEQAKTNGLIDEIGGLHEAVEAAAKLGQVPVNAARGSAPIKNFSGGGLFGSVEAQNNSDSVALMAMRVSESFVTALGQSFAAALVQRLKAEVSEPALPQVR